MATELLASVDELTALLADPEAPVDSDRSFFVCSRGTYSDHTELVELLDPFTGLPYPLLPANRRLPLHDGAVANWHHGMHPRSHEALQTIGGKAIRSAQVQLVAKERHNYGDSAFHNLKVGPRIHRSEGHQLGMCLAAVAGATPKLGIRTNHSELWLHPFTDSQLRQWTHKVRPRLFQPWQAAVFGKFYGIEGPAETVEARLAERNRQRAELSYRNVHYGYEPVRDFFTQAVLSQDLSNADRQVKDFLGRSDEGKGLALIDTAVSELVRTAVSYNGQTLADLYDSLHQAGRINPAMPLKAEELITYKIGDIATRRLLVSRLYDQLAGQAAA